MVARTEHGAVQARLDARAAICRHSLVDAAGEGGVPGDPVAVDSGADGEISSL
jgi:hypothetical protein